MTFSNKQEKQPGVCGIMEVRKRMFQGESEPKGQVSQLILNRVRTEQWFHFGGAEAECHVSMCEKEVKRH